ncbi:MAG TPA: pitrilysin family protein [Thermoanaerobaculia bacterium]|nr:pitrilysin family protein [Thermoanaerobaculia bacterium]
MSRRPHVTRIAAAAAAALAAGALAGAPAAAQEAAVETAKPAIELVTLPSPESPLVAVRLMLDVGSIHDPAGKEGLAALTGLMVAQAGTSERSYSELVEALYPMAASIGVSTDREVTVISGQVHRDTLAEYTALLTEAVLSPGFAAADFERNKEQLAAFLTSTLRSANDELLGLEALQDTIFAGHPYGHPPAGSVQGLAAITLDDVKRFYAEHYTRGNLMLGVAGGYPEGYVERLVARLGGLPAGSEGRMPLPDPPKVEGRRFTLIDKEAGAVGIHFGYPLPLDRADDDWYPLLVANSYLGEHRTFHGRLMQQLRGLRGLNYGDYSYIEYWEAPPFTSAPSPGVPRRQQYFSVWIRPVRPETAHFALRNALYEVERLEANGMTETDFELTRDFLVNYSKLWAQSLSDRLGFHMDSRFYGMPYYIDEIERRLGELTVEEVNAAAKKYLGTDAYQAVLVTDDAAAVAAYLEAGEPSPITYNAEVPAEVTEGDKAIQKLPVNPTAIEIVPVGEVFETGKALGG